MTTPQPLTGEMLDEMEVANLAFAALSWSNNPALKSDILTGRGSDYMRGRFYDACAAVRATEQHLAARQSPGIAEGWRTLAEHDGGDDEVELYGAENDARAIGWWDASEKLWTASPDGPSYLWGFFTHFRALSAPPSSPNAGEEK